MDKAAIWAGVLISLITALGALASSRASSKASTANSKAEVEKEAYDRARKMDVETIERQDKELDEIREQKKLIEEQNRLLREQNDHLNADVKRIDADNRSLHDENRRVLEDNARLRAEVRALRLRMVRYERRLPFDDNEPVTERREDIPPWELEENQSGATAVESDNEPYLDIRGDVDGQEPPER
jgi:hypothetical protein